MWNQIILISLFCTIAFAKNYKVEKTFKTANYYASKIKKAKSLKQKSNYANAFKSYLAKQEPETGTHENIIHLNIMRSMDIITERSFSPSSCTKSKDQLFNSFKITEENKKDMPMDVWPAYAILSSACKNLDK